MGYRFINESPSHSITGAEDMSIIRNIAVIRNWYTFYAGRYGLLRNEFEIIHRNGIRLKVRPHTDDLKIVKSNFVTGHYRRDFIPITKDSIVVDVGAHIGSFSVMAAQTASKVIAFEPDPDNFQMLRKNIELNNLRNILIYPIAVSGHNGYQEMYLFKDGSTGSHSLCNPEQRGLTRKSVQTTSIYGIMEKEGLPVIDFLKLDCEGAEHDILRNMSLETAVRIRAIAMETHGVVPESSVNIPVRLKELGFQVWVERGYVYARRIST
jgi:FkbM family methyltransferase